MIESVEGFRLSPQQEHLWSLQQLDRNTPYRVQVAALIEGDLNIAQLQDALERVVTRHESLRTNFQYFAGLTLPVQVIGENRMSWTATHDLSGLEVDEQQARLDALFEAEKSNAFDLQNGPLLHASLVRLSISRNVLLLGLPAVGTDLQGLRNLVGEVLNSYKACLLGEGPLAEPIQYADISEYLNELLEAKETESGRRYWGSRNGAEFLDLKLPFEVQQAGQTEFEPKFVTLTIRPQLRARVESCRPAPSDNGRRILAHLLASAAVATDGAIRDCHRHSIFGEKGCRAGRITGTVCQISAADRSPGR